MGTSTTVLLSCEPVSSSRPPGRPVPCGVVTKLYLHSTYLVSGYLTLPGWNEFALSNIALDSTDFQEICVCDQTLGRVRALKPWAVFRIFQPFSRQLSRETLMQGFILFLSPY
jgi:hypothetical protein